ncbi:MAG: hypothetical protein JWN98_827 [Abditibacteriota bacterium]|nr:hypothetical protein [Abditibacteriota bacterium]
MNCTSFLRRTVFSTLAGCFGTVAIGHAQVTSPAAVPVPVPAVDAMVYSTMPSTPAHRPQMAMDGDQSTYFKSVYDMNQGDDFQILLSRPIPVRSLRITSGDTDNQDLLSEGVVEISADGTTYTRAATFNAAGVAEATLPNSNVAALRIRLNQRRSIPALVLREITLDSSQPVSHVLLGPGRGFVDTSQAPDVADWARRAEKQLQEFWPHSAALLYSNNFITPNKVNVVYRTGPGVTAVAAAGGGVITVNSQWARQQPNDTGLIVHEAAHVIQAMSAYNPVWLVEGIADYIRWVKFEPQNHKPRINVATASYRDSYRTTGTFLGWCELHYDSTLVTKLNDAVRFGRYTDDLFKKYCGKDVDTLWAEFIAAYKADPTNILTAPVAAGDRPRTLPVVKEGTSVPVSLAASFNASGFSPDGATFPANGGFDAGGASFSATLLGATQQWKGVRFNLGPATGPNIISSRGNVIPLPAGQHSSLWLLAAAVEGNQMAQSFLVTYADGTTEKLVQNFSDWYQPRSFPGESRAVKMAYRNMANGARDARTFYAYTYGFNLNPAKTVQSLTLPQNPNVKLLAITLAN